MLILHTALSSAGLFNILILHPQTTSLLKSGQGVDELNDKAAQGQGHKAAKVISSEKEETGSLLTLNFQSLQSPELERQIQGLRPSAKGWNLSML